MNYIPNTDEDRKQMLDFIGIDSVDRLFDDVKDELKLKKELNLPEPLSEVEILQHMRELASNNASLQEYSSFLGGGAYRHFIPSAVKHLVGRTEFYSSYTPYQAELSQGTLQAIFEFQTMMCELTGMDVTNASMYDGASALAEAAIMASKVMNNRKVLVSKAIHPEYRQVLETYSNAFGLEILDLESDNGTTNLHDLEEKASQVSGVLVQSPNFFGCIEDLGAISKITHEKEIKFIVSNQEPISLGLLAPPGDFNVDILAGEAHSFGNPLSFGGPHLGYIASKTEFVKKLPGRLSGVTYDPLKRQGYILTLQAREQHVRRERATSNICTNQALNALAATIYLAQVGRKGLREIALICAHRARYVRDKLLELEGFEPQFDAPFFNEFAVKCTSNPHEINNKLLEKKIIGGLEMGRYFDLYKDSMLFCVTEMNQKSEIDALIDALKGVKP
jgi:glycine dehydrogenase subunit 1